MAKKARGAKAHSKEKCWGPGENMCVDPAMIYFL